ncbi:DUF4838 domain-containing protein [Puteibacter caeruleilacunae]|nr:DUF4838 domain-containing protein [Puteibacter caeruleilacunae]
MRIFFHMLAFMALIFLASCQNQLTISNNGSSNYQIVIPSNATTSDQAAAAALQNYLQKIGNAQLTIVKDKVPEKEYEICIGNTNRTNLTHPDLEQDGFTIQTNQKKILIKGGTEKGSLYGVYTFLEDFLNCRKYSSTVEVIPQLESIKIPAQINMTQVPVIKFRETYYRDSGDPGFLNWHKLDVHGGEHGEWGYWCHSFHQLVPPEEYAKTHPEYYALRNGNRQPGSQLCLSNPDVLEIAIRNLKKAIDEHPEAKYWSVSQNDNQNYCQCEHCAKIDSAEGTPMGSVLHFVNKVAEHFPDKVISTLAYQYTRSLPKHVRPAKNVNIMLCNIECPRHLPMNEEPSSQSFCKDLEDWGSITNNILLWDYVIQFKNLVSPFPNLHTIAPNIRYLVDNGVTAIFEQGNREIGGEFAELRAYLISKLLWNPNLDPEAIINDFLEGYYGKAAPFIKEYINLSHKSLSESGMQLNIFGNPLVAKHTYLKADLMLQYKSLFDQAEAAVAAHPELLNRVQNARLPIMYAELEIARSNGFEEGGLYIKRHNDVYEPRTEIKNLLDTFIERCNRNKVTKLKEWSTTPDEYLVAYMRLFSKDASRSKAFRKKVDYIIKPNAKYTPNGVKTLTDGVFGSYDFAANWLGYEGKHMEFIVDLDKPTDVHKLSIDFLQGINDWIFLPESVSFYASNDGKKYKLIDEIKNTQPENKKGIFIHTFKTEPNQTLSCKYIKVKAQSILNCPSWHMGAGGPVWIMADELIVE